MIHCHFTAFSHFGFGLTKQSSVVKKRSNQVFGDEGVRPLQHLAIEVSTFYCLLLPRFVNCFRGENMRKIGHFEEPQVPSTQVSCSFTLYLHRHRRFERGDVRQMAEQHATARAQWSRSARRCVSNDGGKGDSLDFDPMIPFRSHSGTLASMPCCRRDVYDCAR